MSTIIPDTPIGVVVEALAVCLCAQILATDGIPGTCFCGIIPGDAIPLDMVQTDCADADGLAYVRLVNTYPSNTPGVSEIRPGNCKNGSGFDLEIGIFRTFPLVKDGGSPEPEVSLEAWRLQMADEHVMRQAINCCEWAESEDFVTGLYTPAGPEGGVLGGSIPISVWMP